MEKIYSYLDQVNQAYLLRTGKVFFGIKEGETYPFEGQNLIVGAEEILLNPDGTEPIFRVYDFFKDEKADLMAVPPANLLGLLPKYAIGFALNVHLSQMILLTNQIYQKRKEADKGGNQEAFHANAKKYYGLVQELETLIGPLRFPGLTTMVGNLKNELLYENGRIISTQEKTFFSVNEGHSQSETLPTGTILCEQGKEGNELFILNKGSIDVLIGQNKVATIQDAGSVIGEIALFLGEKRTATLKAASPVAVTRLRKENLKSFTDDHPAFFQTIATANAKRIKNNFILIRAFDKKNVSLAGKVEIPAFLLGKPGEDKIANLFRELHQIQRFKKFDQLKGFVEKHKADYNKYNEIK